MKIGMTVAAALLLAALLAGCADGGGTTADDGQNGAGTEGSGGAGTGGNGSGTGGGIPSMPAVELPPSEGEDIFKGRTFGDYDGDRYVFSDDRTVVYSHKGQDATLYRYSINESNELCLKTEKVLMDLRGNALRTFDECIEYMASGLAFEDFRIRLEESLDGEFSQDGVSKEDYIEKCIDSEKKFWTVQKQYGYPGIKEMFAYHRYAVKETGGGFVLTEQYEASSAWFDLHSGSDGIDLDICPGIGIANFSLRRSDGEKEKDFYSYFSSNSESGGTISFINYEDASEVFPATYTISGSGNDTTVEMSFKYGGVQYDETLDFKPGTLHFD